MAKKCGYVAILGRPNAGKSTLINALAGGKIVIVSRKPQTTRASVRAIVNVGDSQLVLVDTPGIHRIAKPTRLNTMMNRDAWEQAADADAVTYLIDSQVGVVDADKHAINQLKNPLILVTQIDRLKKGHSYSTVKGIAAQLPDCEVIGLSAKRNEDVQALKARLLQSLPEGPWLFPEEHVTDKSIEFQIAEVIREKTFRNLGAEIPYQTAVRVEEVEDKGKIIHILADIIVNRNSQKGMVIGAKGKKLKEIGQEARLELERQYDKKIYLELRVTVDPDWINRDDSIQELTGISLGSQGPE